MSDKLTAACDKIQAADPVQVQGVVQAPPDLAAVQVAPVEQTLTRSDSVATPEVKSPVSEAPVKAVAKVVDVSSADILTDMGSLALHSAINAALGRRKSPTFKVAALGSGYTTEFRALAFEEITHLQASVTDPYSGRIRLLRTVHKAISEFSCDPLSFDNWLKMTSYSDFDTLMYGLYSATYPGANSFDVNCPHCGQKNELMVDVNQLARVEDDAVYEEIKRLLDPKTNKKFAITNSLVGKATTVKLPFSGILAEVSNPSIQDYLDGVQWFVNSSDKRTGMLPEQAAGLEQLRTMAMYIRRLLIPAAGTDNKFIPVTDQSQIIGLIGRLLPEEGTALSDAINESQSRYAVSYRIPDFNCRACSKRVTDLFLDFETLLFIKLRGKQ